MKQRKIGVMDADYPVYKSEKVGDKYKIVWRCPFLTRWDSMIMRCFSQSYHKKRPTYIGTSIVKEWLTFSNFKKWMEKQDWQGKDLDKDLLFPGNKVYGPQTCVFVSGEINRFINNKHLHSKVYTGVSYDPARKKKQYAAFVSKDGKNTNIGRFDTAEEAHQAWLAFKLEQAKILASEQSDERIAKALIERYENYKET